MAALRAAGDEESTDIVERNAAGNGNPAELRALALRLITTEQSNEYALTA